MGKNILLSFFSLAIVLQNAYANILSKELTKLERNPSLAKTIAVGLVVREKEGELYFIGERGWTLYPKKYNIKKRYSTYNFDIPISGEKRLFYSVAETDDKGTLDVSAYSNSVSLNSSKARQAILNLANKKDFIGSVNPSWQYCENDNECTRIENQCEDTIGLNMKFKKNYIVFHKSQKNKLNCPQVTKKLEVNISKCIENFCS